MLFNFDHQRKLVSDTATVTGETQSLAVPETLLNAVSVTENETVLVLVSDGVRSGLYTAETMQNSQLLVPVEREFFDTLGFETGDTVTYWVTLPDRLDEISVTQGTVAFDDEITGDAADPTDGSWLLIYDDELRYRKDTQSVKGAITLYKDPFRRFLEYTDGQEITTKTVHDDTSVVDTMPMYQTGKGFTIPTSTLRELGVEKTNRDATVWLSTDSLTESPSDTPTPVHEEDHASNDEETQEAGNTSQEPQPTVEMSSTSTEENSQPEDSHSQDSEVEEIKPDLNPDFTAVILLDDDERLQEEWRGHYMKPDGSLVCEKSYTDAVKDPRGKHYTDICVECALDQPGAVPGQDLSLLLSDETGISFNDDLPFMLNRRDAAKLLIQLKENEG